MRNTLLSLSLSLPLLAGCAGIPAQLERVSVEARNLPATRNPYGNCQDHTNAVLRVAADLGYTTEVLRVCSNWFRGGCHVAAVVDIDGAKIVMDNGALRMGETPRLEEVQANYQTSWVLPAEYITKHFPK